MRHLFTEEPAFQLEWRDNAHGLILDEAQSVPSVFGALRGFIDRDRKRNGRFLLLGSAHPSLIRQVSESLAGRVGILDLDPFTMSEVAGKSPRRALPDLWLRGGFPDAFAGNFREWWEAYLRTYRERDLSQLGVGADPILLRRLLMMLAHCQGGLLNLSQLGQSLGVSYHTVDRYVNVLEQTFLVRRLLPYHRNVGKRLVKAAKVYLRDTGLLHHLLNLSTLAELENHPVRGASWETFVSEDVIRREKLASPQSQFFFWRTASGAEIDLVIERGPQRFGFESRRAAARKWCMPTSWQPRSRTSAPPAAGCSTNRQGSRPFCPAWNVAALRELLAGCLRCRPRRPGAAEKWAPTHERQPRVARVGRD